MFVATKVSLYFCRDKIMFVATKVFSRKKFCRDSRQTRVCRGEKRKIIVAAPANDREYLSVKMERSILSLLVVANHTTVGLFRNEKLPSVTIYLSFALRLLS